MDIMKNKIAIITGASSGIGRATALKFAAENAKVALVARSAGKLQELANTIQADGGQAVAIPADLMQAAEAERVVQETVAAWGGIDVLVNAAGILVGGDIESTPLADWEAMMNINARAPFLLMQAAMPHLIERRGNVVNVSSVTGVRAFPGVLAYCSSKAALDQLSHCAALEVAAKGVRINAVNPGVVRTMLHRAGGMDEEKYAAFVEHSKSTHPLGRVGRPEEIADLIFFLASPQANWITGVSYSIDGGRAQTCAR